jgi:putative transposase
MSDRYHNQFPDGAACFWTSSVVDHIPVFRSRTACLALLDVWNTYRARYGIKLLGYVIMPEHIHVTLWSEKGERAERFVEQTFRRSSAEIASMTQKAAGCGNDAAAGWLRIFQDHARGRAAVRVWKERGRGFPVTEPGGLGEKLEYMHKNPVRRGLVEVPEDWEFSSAAWYASGTGPIAMDEFEWL